MHIGVSAELSEHIEKNFLRPRKAKEKLPRKNSIRNFSAPTNVFFGRTNVDALLR